MDIYTHGELLKRKTVLGTNILTAVNSQAYGNHIQHAYRIGRETSDDIILVTPYRSAIDRMRNMCGKIALQHEADYLMFVDDDVLIQPRTYQRMKYMLEKRPEIDILMAMTWIRGYPFQPMFFKEVIENGSMALAYYHNWETDDKNPLDSDGLLKCAAVGFSCVLIRTTLLKRVTEPWFITGARSTEDVYFCLKARMECESVGIYVDSTISTGHLLDNEFITAGSREALRHYCEEMNPALRDEFTPDRQEQYIKRQMERIVAKYGEIAGAGAGDTL